MGDGAGRWRVAAIRGVSWDPAVYRLEAVAPPEEAAAALPAEAPEEVAPLEEPEEAVAPAEEVVVAALPTPRELEAAEPLSPAAPMEESLGGGAPAEALEASSASAIRTWSCPWSSCRCH